MGLLDLFRRAPRIADAAALADFVDRNSAFLVQKGIYEYSRARAGPYSKLLMVESSFIEEVEKSRWQAFPLGIAMVAEMVDGVLRPEDEAQRAALLEAIAGVALEVFDRYPRPPRLAEGVWSSAREELSNRLALIGLHPRKLVKDIPEPYAQRYFSLMPIHERLRGEDFPTLHSYLKITLCNIHDEFVRRMDAPALRASLHAPSQAASI
jgi:hypothetical protein